jgi:hypothetical protein
MPEGPVVGVFARADHPHGWGFVTPGEHHGRAHGYVVLFVRCDDSAQLAQVAERLARQDFTGKPDTQYSRGGLSHWFGGRFELLATAPDVDVPYGPFSCRGDHRMIAVYDAADVLAA